MVGNPEAKLFGNELSADQLRLSDRSGSHYLQIKQVSSAP
jgi:hypothetical protein